MTVVDDEVTTAPPVLSPYLVGPDVPPRAPGYEPRHALPNGKRDRTNLTLWIVLILMSSFVAGTTAAFSASTTDSGNVFGSASLSQPAGQDPTLSGNDLNLVITALGAFDGSPGGVTYGSRWRYFWPTGVSNTGTPYGCPATTSSYTTDLADSATTAKTIDYTTVSGFADGRWMCIMAHTAFPQTRPAAPAEQWYSQQNNPTKAMLLGHVIQSIDLQDGGGTANRIQQNDRIVVTFNQAVEPSNRPASGFVCVRNAVGRIFIGAAKADGTDANNCNSNTYDAVKVAYLEVQGTTSLGANGAYTVTTWSWSGDGKQLTITLNSNVNVLVSCTGTGCTRQFRSRMGLTFGPSTHLETNTTPSRALCTSTDNDGPDNGSCEPMAIGSF